MTFAATRIIHVMAKTYLEITFKVADAKREQAVEIYKQYKTTILQTFESALSMELLVHVEGIQLLIGFNSVENAQEYLLSTLFNDKLVVALKPFMQGAPDVKIYSVV